MPYLMDEAQHWRERAERMVALADLANDQVAKQTMLSIAAGYENLAARAEERLWAASDRSAPPGPPAPTTGEPPQESRA